MSVRSSLVGKIIAADVISLTEIFSKKGRIYTFVNPVSYLIALKNRPLFMKYDGIFSDGSILVAAIFILYHNKVTRRSFDMTSLAPLLFSYADRYEKSICIVASKKEQVDKAVEIFSAEYPHIKWIGCRDGYFSSDKEIEEEADHITKLKPDYLLVGMGSMKQESFLLMCQEKGFSGIGFTCGGFIHQVASLEHAFYYPRWVNRLNLRWIYRFCREKHTRKRYVYAAFVFPMSFFMEWIRDFFCIADKGFTKE